MPPSDLPLPRFVAEPPHELQPYGRWEEQLSERLLAAVDSLEAGADRGAPGPIAWFPERTYGRRTYVPAVAPLGEGGELFGYVSFVREEQGPEPGDFEIRVDYTDETADVNPQWKLDLNEEVIGTWRGPGGATADLTLVWGVPLVPGGVAATGELGDETVDQCALVQSDRFTLVALDAVSGLGPEMYLDVKLWSKRGELLASESLYDEE